MADSASDDVFAIDFGRENLAAKHDFKKIYPEFGIKMI
jgi:hypothetical protein